MNIKAYISVYCHFENLSLLMYEKISANQELYNVTQWRLIKRGRQNF